MCVRPRTKKQMRTINKVAEIIECQLATKGSVPPLASILELRAFDLCRVLEMDPNFLEDVEHHHSAATHRHGDAVSSCGFEICGEMDMDRLNTWLEALLRDRGADIFRMKGVVAINGCDDKYVFQGVHMVFDGEPLAPWAAGEARKSTIIFIGRNLRRDE